MEAEVKPSKMPIILHLSLIHWVYWAIASFPLAILIFIGSSYGRYIGDDYSTASVIKTIGFWKSQSHWYFGWTGAYTYTFLTSFLGLFGVSSVVWLHRICLISWLVLVWRAFDYSFQVAGLFLNKIWLAILAAIAIYVTIMSFEDYTQVPLWLTSIIAYLSNSMIFTAIILYFTRRFCLYPQQVDTIPNYVLLFSVFLIYGGICETWGIMQIALFSLGAAAFFIITDLTIRKSYLRLMVLGFLASVVAFFIMFIAPGNAARDKNFFAITTTWVVKNLIASFRDVFKFLGELVQGRTLLVITLVLVGVLAGFVSFSIHERLTKNQVRFVIYSILVSVTLLWMSLFPGFFVFGRRPPERSIFTGLFAFVFGMVIVFVYLGKWLHQILNPSLANVARISLYVLVFITLIFSPLRTSIALINLIPIYKHYAEVWDQRDLYIRQAQADGQKDVVIYSFKGDPYFRDIRKTIWVKGDMEPNPRHWINQAAAVYYGLNSIVAEIKP